MGNTNLAELCPALEVSDCLFQFFKKSNNRSKTGCSLCFQRGRCSDLFQNHGDTLAYAYAHGAQGITATGRMQAVDGGGG
jgi:hypothetical protein